MYFQEEQSLFKGGMPFYNSLDRPLHTFQVLPNLSPWSTLVGKGFLCHKILIGIENYTDTSSML